MSFCQVFFRGRHNGEKKDFKISLNSTRVKMLIKVHTTWHKNQLYITGSLKFWLQSTVVAIQLFILSFGSWRDGGQRSGLVGVHGVGGQPAGRVLRLPAWAGSAQPRRAGLPGPAPAARGIPDTCSGKDPPCTASAWHCLPLGLLRGDTSLPGCLP